MDVTVLDLSFIGSLISGLLGQDVEVTATAEMALVGRPHMLVSEFCNDADEPAAYIVCEPALAVWFAAALSMLPPNIAKRHLRDPSWEGLLAENFHEVMNVSSRFFNGEDWPHVRLVQVYDHHGRLDQEVAASVKAVRSRLFLQVVLPRYGHGRMALLGV